MTAKRMATDPPQEMPDSTRRRGPEAMEGVEDTLSSGPQNAKAVLSGTTNGSNGDLLSTAGVTFSPSFIVSQLEKWTNILTSRASRGNGQSAEAVGNGSITLSHTEVSDLQSTLTSTLQAFLAQPVSQGEMILLFNSLLDQASKSEGPPQATLPPPPPPVPSAASALPADIILLIVESMRELYATNVEDNAGTLGQLWSLTSSWKEIRDLSRINKYWSSVLRPLYSAECHVTNARTFPVLAKRLKMEPLRAAALTSLHIRIYDFEYSFSAHAATDAGFSIPECITLAPNLLHLSITSSRNESEGWRRRERSPLDFTTFTGGVNLARLIPISCKQLRTLTYGIPCTIDDVSSFLTELPDLTSIAILGEVDQTSLTIPFKAPSDRLRKIWLPTSNLMPKTLDLLLSSSRVYSLAFTCDIDDHTNPVAPLPEHTAIFKQKLLQVFEKYGPLLEELSISTPFSDGPDLTRMRIPMGAGVGGGGNWIGNGPGGNIAMQIIHTVNGAFNIPPLQRRPGAGPPPIPVPAVGGPVVAPAPGPIPVPGLVPRIPTAAGAVPPPAAMPGVAPPPVIPNPVVPPPIGGNPPPIRAPAPRVPANANGNGNNGGFALPAGFPQGFFAFGGGGPAVPNPPLVQYFEEILHLTPNLTHLSLYGRRYSSSLLETILRFLPLQFLALSVPSEDSDRREVFVRTLKEVIEGGLEELKSVELSGRGGEWTPSERRVIKTACEEREVAYCSSN